MLGRYVKNKRETAILFIADHGDMMGDHHLHRKTYAYAGIVMRICRNCGLEQNHCGKDEPLDPARAAEEAPAHQVGG